MGNDFFGADIETRDKNVKEAEASLQEPAEEECVPAEKVFEDLRKELE